MRSAWHLLVCMFLLISPNFACAINYEEGSPIVESAKSLALLILKSAQTYSKSAFYLSAIDQLNRNHIWYPTDQFESFDGCYDGPRGQVLAFVWTWPFTSLTWPFKGATSDIYLCYRPKTYERRIEKLAQILIHENVHTLNYFDECEVTTYELNTYVHSGRHLSYLSAWFERCHIQVPPEVQPLILDPGEPYFKRIHTF